MTNTTNLKNHHNADIVYFTTDIATINFIGFSKDFKKPLMWTWFTGEDGYFKAYICDDTYLIPSYYNKVFECRQLKAIDDDHIQFNSMETNFNWFEVYRAGDRGCIIKCLK